MSNDRQAPKVPNHEMVRAIGRGAYGEIWLARSVTGPWRAVKIVDRRTFDSEKAFQREFEGMSRFEPFSREDPGFVDILHVGRDEGGHFFYYVMELADDHLGGENIDPNRYVPKTLKSELGRCSRLLVDECITIGLSLTSALAALHRQGLSHRDIKPANIIFVGGVPKIADIGLVAAHGQDSFVGTEGYVPPEGPGSVQADIYSLGKVLYELAMGKDRLDFPSVCSRLDDLPDKTGLLQLNEVLLRACASDPSERYPTALKMHEDLLLVRDGRPLRRHGKIPRALFVVALLLCVAVAGVYGAFMRKSRGTVLIETEPPGAMVVFSGTMRRSPARFDQVKLGDYSAHVMLPGYEPVDVKFAIGPRAETHPPQIRLHRQFGSAQLDSRPTGAQFELRAGDAVVRTGRTPVSLADLPTGPYQLVLKLDGREQREDLEVKRGEVTDRTVEFASGHLAVTSHPAGAEILLDGKPAGTAPLDLSVAEGAHELTARYQKWPRLERRVSVRHDVPAETDFEFATGSVKITSAPGGASIFAGDAELGLTPLTIPNLDPGPVTYELRLAGYKPLSVSGAVKPGEQIFLPGRFVQRTGPQRGEEWENSLGMKFVPVGDVLMAVWPTRVQDYEAYCAERRRARLPTDFPQDPTHPVVRVNWADANDFCEWLTRRERAAGQLEEGQHYRLPTDLEWSAGVEIEDDPTRTPEQREGKVSAFPWGTAWPPPPHAGNFADGPSHKAGEKTIPGYHDGYPQTSPVGAFGVNRLGLADMSGNVWQWCFDGYRGGSQVHGWGVLRGGSWGTGAEGELRPSFRNVVDPSYRDVTYGFRCVIVPDAER